MSRRKTAVITGGTSGIGSAICMKLKNDNWDVISLGFCGGQFKGSSFLSHDLSNETGLTAAVHDIKNRLKSIDLLVNSAGRIHANTALASATPEVLRDDFFIHVISPVFLSLKLAKELESGTRPLIITLGSIYGKIPDNEVATYCLSKSPADLISKHLAAHFGPKVRAITINPGHIDTPMTAGAPDDFKQEVINKTAMKRIGSSDEVAEMVLDIYRSFNFVTGASIDVDGGFAK